VTDHFDVVIIGGGNAGFGVSSIAAEAGMRLAFIESRDFGGTCPNRGCTPKKILVAAAQSLDIISRASVHGIHVGSVELDWGKLIERELEMVSGIPAGMEGLAAKRGQIFKGSARFTGSNQIDVDGQEISAEHFVIATGSRPRDLPIPGAELLVTSDEVLSERRLPSEVVFVGGGVIAMEFGHVYSRAGVKVTILEAAPRLLGRLEADAVDVLRAESERLGITIKTGVKITEISDCAGRRRVDFEHENEAHSATGDMVVNGAGRIPNVQDLDLDAGLIAHDGLKIHVDEYLRSTSNQNVWVAGDALATSAQLSPLATYEGRIVGENIVNGPISAVDYSVVPSSVYTIPTYSGVGLTEEQAQGLDFRVASQDMTEWFSSRSYGESAAWCKILIDNKTDQIIGAHLIGHHGEDLIGLFVMAMRHQITASAMKDTIFAYPTFSADVRNML
jgi:glutathione reductase (NADPH)